MTGFQQIDFRDTGLDTDSDLRVIAPGDSDERWNCVLDSTRDNSLGNIQNDWGMTLQNYSQPGGDNEVIGSVKDTQNNAIIYFVWNSNQYHQIRRWYSETGVTELVLQSNFLNFQRNWKIYHSNVNGDILSWTDGYQDSNNELLYNSPREISISKSIGYSQGLPWPQGYSSVDLQVLEAVIYPPLYPPSQTFVSVPNVQSLIVGEYTQFFTRYVSFNKGKSIFSPFSPLNISQNEDANGDYDFAVDNAIDVTFQTGHFTVEKIELCAKINNAYYLIDVLDKYDTSGAVIIPSNSTHTYRYFGERQLGVLDQLSVLKTQEFLPQVAYTQEVVQGNTMVYGNYIEGLAAPQTNLTATVKMKRATDTAPHFNNLDPGQFMKYRSLSLKRLGIYRIGVIYKMDQGYHCPVSTPLGSQVQIPWWSDPNTYNEYYSFTDEWILSLNQKPYIEWNLSSTPPIWATSYEIVITKDLRDLEKTITFVQWGAAIGGETGIYQDKKTSIGLPSTTGYSFEKGDRLRLIATYNEGSTLGLAPILTALPSFGGGFYAQDISETYNNPSGIVYDFAIESFDLDNLRINVSGEIDGLEATATYIWEIYNPTKKTTSSSDGGENSEIYYGVGQAYPINNPGQPSRSHSTETGIIEGVDIYHRWKKIVWKPSNVKFRVDKIGLPPGAFPNCTVILNDVNLVTASIFKESVSTVLSPVLSNLNQAKTNALTKDFKDEKYGTSFNGNWSTFNMFFGSSTAPNAGLVSSSTIINLLTGSLGFQNAWALISTIFNPHSIVDISNNPITTLAGVANGIMDGGDATIEFPTRNNPALVQDEMAFNIYILCESHSISDFYDSDFDSVGKGYVEDDLETRKSYPTNLRHGGQLIEDTNTNDLFSFDAKNYNDEIPTTYNEITRIRYVGYSLVIRQKNKSNTMYIGRQEVKSSDGSTILAVSENIFGSINPSKENSGSYHPGADISSPSNLYYFDVVNGKVMRDSLNGLQSISSDEGQTTTYRMDNFFRKLAQKVRNISGIEVIGIWDEDIGCFTMTVRDTRTRQEGQSDESVTIVFHERTNRWKSFMNYIPEWYESIGEVIVAFKDGQLWKMYSDPINRNTYFDTHYPQKIAVICNDGYNTRKVFNNIKIDSNVSWDIELTTPPNATYPLGMKSRLKKEKLQNMEGGGFYGSFMKDMNTPGFTNPTLALVNGRELRGEVLKALLTNNEVNFVYLRQVIVHFTVSEQTT